MGPNEWATSIPARTDDFSGLAVSLITGFVAGSISSPFRVVADDGQSYWVKVQDYCLASEEAALVKEYVVARVGALIGAPVCHTSLISIPPALHGVEVRPGRPIASGIGHASLALEHADERGRPRLVEREKDDNRRRQAKIYALFDWCCGTDQQWLYDLDDDLSIHSHDHGRYLPPMNSGLLEERALIDNVHLVNPLPDPPAGLDRGAIDEVVTALRAVDESDLLQILGQVPASWPVADEVLGALGWFLMERARPVADRIDKLF